MKSVETRRFGSRGVDSRAMVESGCHLIQENSLSLAQTSLI